MAHGEHAEKDAEMMKGKNAGGITSAIHGFLQGIVDRLAKTLRSFVAFSLAMFFIGGLFGYFLPAVSERLAIDPLILLAAPLLLAVLAYYVTEIAALIFILLLGLFLLFFL